MPHVLMRQALMLQVLQQTARHFGAARQPAATPLRSRALLRAVERLLHNLLHKMHGWSQRSRQRAALSGLDDRLLGDIGVSRAAAAEEAAKPFWM